MASIRTRKSSGTLFFDFQYKGVRCREQTSLPDTPANRKKMKKMLERIEAEITLASFQYERYFPESPRAATFKQVEAPPDALEAPLFAAFSELWLGEMQVQWRRSHYDTVAHTFKKHLNPAFGEQEISNITKADILQFRSSLAKVPGRSANGCLSATRINHIMTPLRMILNEAADRFDFISPYRGIKSLKVPKTDVEPFSLEEVQVLLATVRPDYRPYYTARFFTGLRTSEIHGLRWEHVDFERRLILVREAWVKDEVVYTKTDGSCREIQISQIVLEALEAQYLRTGHMAYVFANRAGDPLNANNVTKRVWYPLLRHLRLKKRRPYQTRHTAATLWLASGESPEWIARQMGHTTTEMLFRVYSRYVPNLTRQDGSAFERLLMANFNNNNNEENTHA